MLAAVQWWLKISGFRMAKYLFTWEFGAGLGHLRRFLPIARELRAAGHEITIVAPDPAEVRAALSNLLDDDSGYGLEQGFPWPVPNDPRIREVPTHTFADVLRLFDYFRVEKLLEFVQKWQRLVAEIRPDIIVSDFSPTVALAVRDRIPRVVVGNGYTIPPAGKMLPPMRPWVNQVFAYSRGHEGDALAAVNRVAHKLRDPALHHFADLFAGQHTFVCTIPEFDPYTAYRDGRQFFPFNIDRIDAGPPVDRRGGNPLVCYLPGNHTQLQAIIEGITASGFACDAFITAPPGKINQWTGANVRLHAQPLDLASALPRAPLIVHHAGLGTALAALLAGTPHYVLTQNLEHQITAHGLLKFGATTVTPRNETASVEEITQTIKHMVADAKVHSAAAKSARKMRQRAGEDSLAKVVDACLSLAAAV